MRTPFVVTLLALGLLSMGGDCRQTAEVQCDQPSDCTEFCTAACVDQPVKAVACPSGFCVCECGDMGTGGSGGQGGSGGAGGSGGTAGAGGSGGTGG